MMKKLFAILLTLSMLFTTAVLLAACAANDGVPKEAKQLFQKYMDGCANDLHEAAKVVLFTDDAERVSFEDDAPIPGTYKVLEWRKISDSLWAVDWESPDEFNPNKQTSGWSFVVLIDGQYYVTRGLASVPKEMRDAFDTEPYMPTGDQMLPALKD